MQEIIKNYQNITSQYKDKAKIIEGKKDKLEKEIEIAKEKLSKLNQEYFAITNPDVFSHLIEPLAVKLANYYNKLYLFDFKHQKEGIFTIYLIDNPKLEYYQQPNFRLTIRPHTTEDGIEWLEYAKGKGEACTWVILPVDLQQIVFLLR